MALGCQVLESGTVTGSFTTPLSRALDFHGQRTVLARFKNIRSTSVREGNFVSWQDNEGGSTSRKSSKKRQWPVYKLAGNASSLRIMANRNSESRGHTVYLRFIKIKCNE
ncbi:Hypothetical predicted protein [Olea europaea subsp. europaea]|uniref:Uncharacterized protein n=1 Tax=Olea europaea subsp. europaea TaxID=158383 RepID=A0A8S0SWZ7_OLEEU|nr:Hypothetical predicted protein [Olea europaea subsp. europaea]